MLAITDPTYRRLLRYALRYKGFLLLSIVGFVVFSAMEASLVQTLKYFIRFLEEKSPEPLYFIPAEITGSILFVPIAVVVLSTLRGIGTFTGNYFMSLVGLNVVNTLRKEVFAHMLYLPQRYYDKHNSGELVSLIIYNIEQVTSSVTNAIKILLRDGFSVIAFLGCLLYINWQLTLIFVAVGPLLGGIIFAASRYFRKTSRKIQSSVGTITHVAQESFQGIQLVKSYLGENYEKARFDSAADTNKSHSMKYERVKALQTPVLHVLIAVALACIFYLVMKVWRGDSADAIAYVTYAGMIAKPFRQLSEVNSMIQRGIAAAETIFATLDSHREPDHGGLDVATLRGEIVFDGVGFAYGDGQAALSGINLSVAAGETVALVGASGSGKSTLASLLLRFYEIQQGDIRIDGVSIRELPLHTLRRNIALVNQQTVLFNDSVRANIAYGTGIPTDGDIAVNEAAEHAYARHFIDQMEAGFDTAVGEDGGSLSGGQRQRIAIARALFKNAPILILDEATSALDNESEKQVQQALETLKRGRTTLIIAHRLSTIESADRIVVMDQGRIVEQGSHRALLQQNGLYARLYQAQRG